MLEAEASLDGTILLSLLCSDQEGFPWFRGTRDEFGDVTANCRSMFESMSGTATNDPSVFKRWMAVD